MIQTPHIDALAAESSQLSDDHVAPTCSPSRAALLTCHWTDRTCVWQTVNGRSMPDQGLPIWLSALHLDGAEIEPVHEIRQVISVENETSFIDRIEQLKDDRSTILVYTEGHAIRAVITLLRLIASSFPTAESC